MLCPSLAAARQTCCARSGRPPVASRHLCHRAWGNWQLHDVGAWCLLTRVWRMSLAQCVSTALHCISCILANELWPLPGCMCMSGRVPSCANTVHTALSSASTRPVPPSRRPQLGQSPQGNLVSLLSRGRLRPLPAGPRARQPLCNPGCLPQHPDITMALIRQRPPPLCCNRQRKCHFRECGSGIVHGVVWAAIYHAAEFAGW